MFYEFPVINNISDVLPAIEGSSEFIVADRGDHITINYVVSTPDTFPPVFTAGGSAKMRATATRNKAIRRECRGMIFDKATGDLLRRPYHKFFNLNQIAETQIDKVDLTVPHIILEKLDGSMIVPYRINGRVIWGTKMGDTDVCTPVEAFVKKHPKYVDAFKVAEANSLCMIFEWMSRVQRIVIDHPEDRLVLTAIRHLNSGEYVDYQTMIEFAAYHSLPVVDAFQVDDTSNMEAVMDYVRRQQGTEGCVIRYANGHMLKIKSEWYSAIHGAKDLITEEKNVVDLIVNERLDDIKALVLEEDRANLDRYERDFWDRVERYSFYLALGVGRNRKQFATRKDYALNKAKDDPDYARVATFHFFDEGTTATEVRQFVIDRFIKQPRYSHEVLCDEAGGLPEPSVLPVSKFDFIPQYEPAECIVIRKGSDPFGELLNMTGGFPVVWDNRTWKSTEALYQAARFPDNFKLQEEIRHASNGFTAKLVAKAHANETRDGWIEDKINVRAMLQCLGLKYTQHEAIREVIARVAGRQIVEFSTRDDFWGAKPQPNGTLIGKNVLGQMWTGIARGIPMQPMESALPGVTIDQFVVDKITL